MSLKYTGNGLHIVGVPARDLSDDDVKNARYTEKDLIGSGIYKKVNKKSEKAEEA